MNEFDAKKFLSSLTSQPGVYEYIDANGEVIYVGKARNLKKRVSSYFQRAYDAKTIAMLQQMHHINITITHNDNEALLLESNLIKKLKPRYNITLRDDKSYPYLYLSSHQDFPRLDIYRGAKHAKGKYFGPFPSASSVRETLALLQKIFKIRQCSDHFFSLRTRPCLQYFIDRCTAPCVGYVDVDTYQQNVQLATLFLEGKNSEVIETLAQKMEETAAEQQYETAAKYRDQIVSLRHIQEKQYASGNGGDIDIIAITDAYEHFCIQILNVRGGRLLGGKPFFPRVPAGTRKEEVLSTFLPQYYLDTVRGEIIPRRIIINIPLEDQNWIAAALSQQLQQPLEIVTQVRGAQRKLLELAINNAHHALHSHVSGKLNFYQRLEALQTTLKLSNLPQRIECFDISHTMGEATVASCVVFDTEGANKKYYRRFNIKGIRAGDDYAAITQALTRHYTRLKELQLPLPDILMIDGGKGQLSIAKAVLEELQVSGVILMAIAKGPERKPGLETLFLAGQEDHPLHLEANSAALHVIQQIRDEAHRFAIMGHRKQRAKVRVTSTLENIPGVGAKRRRELLRQFGGLQELKRASVDDLTNIPGVSHELAQRIFDYLHDQ